MKKIITLFVIISFAVFSCINLSGCKSAEEDLIVVDFSQEYPLLNLKLSDIADISYIKLQGKDSARFLSSAGSFGNSIYIDSNWLFISDSSPYIKEGNTWMRKKSLAHLYKFDLKGNFIHSVVKPSNNEEGFNAISLEYDIDPIKKHLYVGSRFETFIKCYDYNGNLIGTDSLGKEYSHTFLEGNNLICYDNDSEVIIALSGRLEDNGRTLSYYNLDSKTFQETEDLKLGRPLSFTSSSREVSKGLDGHYISTLRSDTVFQVNTNLDIVPKFAIKRLHKNRDITVVPLVETQEYIIFCNMQDEISQRDKTWEKANYIYIKSEKQIYKLTVCHKPSKEKSILGEELLEDKIYLQPNFLTRHNDVMVCVFKVPALKENYNLLPDDLKRITDASSEDDNPVLMIMRFGKQLPKVSSLVQ